MVFSVLCSLLDTVLPWTPIIVKNVTTIGPQLTPDVTYVSRDGGYSVLVKGNIVWLYDDTECMDLGGKQLSFVSNTAAYADQPNKNLSTVADFGVMQVGSNNEGSKNYAILADASVGTGGWIPFQPDELDFNQQKKGVERVAICELPLAKWILEELGLTNLTRAWYVSNTDQYHSSLSVRSIGLRGHQATRSVQGVSSSRDDSNLNRRPHLRTHCHTPRRSDNSRSASRFWRIFNVTWINQYQYHFRS